jgi:hypothetical protein
MHNFTCTPVWKFECQCGFVFYGDEPFDNKEARQQINEHRQEVVFESGNQYCQPHGDDLIETNP